MSSTEAVMSAIFTSVGNATGFLSVVRGSDSVLGSGQLPGAVLTQGDESCQMVTIGGRMECDLSVSILIVCLKGTQNYETTLNNLKRNMLIELMAANFFFEIDEKSSGAPVVEQIEGESLYSMSVQFEVNYTRNRNDPSNGEI